MRIDQLISGEAVDRFVGVLLLVGLDGSILDANPAALDCYGYSHAEILALSIRDIRAPQDQEAADGQMREAAEHGVLFEVTDRRSDGTLFPAEVRSAPVNVDGETALLSVVRDITERKQAEEALRYAENRFRLLFDKDPDGIVIINPATARPVEFNETAHRQLGYTREEFAGLSVKFTDSGAVSLGVSVENEQMLFAVADTGCGIRVDDVPRIMDDFYQAAPTAEAKSAGTGLGLIISSRLAEAIGGHPRCLKRVRHRLHVHASGPLRF